MDDSFTDPYYFPSIQITDSTRSYLKYCGINRRRYATNFILKIS
jgi:hypothetical protein